MDPLGKWGGISIQQPRRCLRERGSRGKQSSRAAAAAAGSSPVLSRTASVLAWVSEESWRGHGDGFPRLSGGQVVGKKSPPMDLAGRSSVNMGGAQLGGQLVLPRTVMKQVYLPAPPPCPVSVSEGNNADAIEHGGVEGNLHGDHDAVIQDQAESGDGGSAQSTGKVDPQAPGWTKRVRVGNQPPDRAPCPERVRVGKHPPDRAPCPERVGAPRADDPVDTRISSVLMW